MKRFIHILFVLCCVPAVGQELLKTSSTLYPAETIAEVQRNVANDPWAASVRDSVVAAAEYWKNASDEELWGLVFGPAISRSWMVWSNGYSPVTGEPVPMYNWVADAQNHPWKLQDPTSGEWFPKNDFKAFHDSGLDEQGLFDPARADRSLLFNTDHPDPADPLHLFGVDDGEGYVNEKGERRRFIGAYLIYGQWKQLIVNGIRVCSGAYVLTGDRIYAHKAGILLDRVADVHPMYDFKTQGVMYEGPASAGYVSTWHDACEETREMVISYDMVFEGLRQDEELVRFLSAQAERVGLENRKGSFAEIQRNIEGRILRDALAHPDKVYSNYPRTEVLKSYIVKVLQEPDGAFWDIVNPMIEKATAVDGVTGEKGLAGYASYTVGAMATFLAEWSRADPAFLPDVIERFPALRQTFRFHIDTYCLNRYYPLIGDTGQFAGEVRRYMGMSFVKPGASLTGFGTASLLCASNYRLLWDFYQATGDPAYVQVLYRENGGKSDGLPYDIFRADGAEFRKQVNDVIDREGTLFPVASVNKEQWHLGILRSGRGSDERALWLDYDAGGGHGHQDGMNLGLFAYGLDLMPEMGYPPVQFGGWESSRAKWYTKTAAHNTVVIDGKNQDKGDGTTTLWADGAIVHGIRADGADIAKVERYERTALLVDIDEAHAYMIDVFRVRGGHEHTKFQQSHFADLTTTGLSLEPAELFPDVEEMRNHRLDSRAAPGWEAHWSIHDDYGYLNDDAPRGLRYWDFTSGAAAGTSEAWVVPSLYEGSEERWIPRIVVQRTGDGDAPLESTFVSVMEPTKGEGVVASVKRLATESDGDVVLEVTLTDGRRDQIAVRDSGSEGFAYGDPAVMTDAAFTLVRFTADGSVQHGAIANGRYCETGMFRIDAGAQTTFAEFNGE